MKYLYRVTPPEGSMSAGGHGTSPQSIGTKWGGDAYAEDLARMLKDLPGYSPEKPIYIYACGVASGDDSLAEELSRLLDNPIIAPPFVIKIDSNGNVTPPVSEWRKF